jgi:MoaA/NifB/PqqE/SkfB family radical SAM enzyme
MASFTHKAARLAFSKALDVMLDRVYKDREKGLTDALNVIEKFAPDTFSKETYAMFRKFLTDPNEKWNQYLNKLIDELDPNVLKMTLLNLVFEAMINGTKTIRANREKYGCNIPWLILMDPTSACNLHCTGCWAAEYGHKLNLSFEDLDRIVTQGKELGVYFYMFTGGEPLVRKADILKLCKKHHDCEFHAYTNGTLIDDEFAEEVRKVGNLSFSISLEGFSEVNDLRRGDGVFARVMKAMDILKAHGCFFGTSICYTAKNLETVTSDEFLDMEIEKGVRFSWYFHLMPVGMKAAPDLMPSPEQREYIYHRIREIRANKGGKMIYTMDFQNDGEFVGGCIAGGRNYFHINANGDAEPCVFIHYSDSNIHEKSVLECLQSPLFMQYRAHQPFNKNMLRPCPMLENPGVLTQMVNKSGAHSTDLQEPESAEHLCGKCVDYAKAWKPVADKLWAQTDYHPHKYENWAGFNQKDASGAEASRS